MKSEVSIELCSPNAHTGVLLVCVDRQTDTQKDTFDISL